jgi:hypothetical protein
MIIFVFLVLFVKEKGNLILCWCHSFQYSWTLQTIISLFF